MAVLKVLFQLILLATGQKFNEYEIIMAHDAATAMLSLQPTAHGSEILNPYAQTQANGTLYDVINCGARALDLRVNRTNAEIKFHHGGVKIAYNVSDAILDVVKFLKQNQEELIVLYWTCNDELCYEVLNQTLSQLNIPLLYGNCTGLANLDVSEVRRVSEVNTGGSLLSLEEDCIEQNYDKQIQCWGEKYSCIGDNSEVSFNKFWEYMNRTYEKDYTNKLWMIQAHWQYDGTSVVVGTLHGSSILDDTLKSEITEKFRSRVETMYSSVKHNFVELDNICRGTSSGSSTVLIILLIVGGVLLCIIIIIIIAVARSKYMRRKGAIKPTELANPV